MSSFICSAKHFNSIEKKLIELVTIGDRRGRFEVSEIQKFINNLRELNVLCVSFQYKSHFDGNLDQEIKEQKTIVKMKDRAKELTALGLYNALRCVSYQCETEELEGLFDSLISDTMPMLKTVISFAASVVIDGLPDDKTNTWSIN